MGCGMTRALWSASRLHYTDAFHYHPLWPLVFVWLPLGIFRKKINKKVFNFILGVTVVAFIMVYLYRMFYVHDNVVVFEPQNSIFGRLHKYLTK